MSVQLRTVARSVVGALVLLIVILGLVRLQFRSLSESPWPRRDLQTPLPGEEQQHPVERMHFRAKAAHEAMLKRQSTTYDQAVSVYIARYSRHPPAGFAKWFQLAQEWNSPVIDEFDDIDLQLRPFRPFLQNGCDTRPYTNQECTDRKMIQVCFRDGQVQLSGWREDWHEGSLMAMTTPLAQDMPNMCIFINYLDEPRLLLPFATPDSTTASSALDTAECHSLDFVNMGHQNVWSEASMPCPLDSPARVRPAQHESRVTSLYAESFDPVLDLCQLTRDSAHGLLASAENLFISHDFVPVLSASKLSTFGDILFPSPWRFSKRSEYGRDEDVTWEEKQNRLFWRGSTTGGHGSGKGDWQHFHRQHVVDVLTEKQNDAIDVAFTAVIQCEDRACEDQSSHFDLHNRTRIRDNWQYKWILDMDGNGFSGRFYDLLRSQSLVLRYKFSREWHDQRLQPWLHYIPLSGDLNELDDLLEFLSTPKGDAIGKEIARAGSEWVTVALRRDDMMLYFHRLLLEMANGRGSD